ncbi:MAG: ubiquitin-like domain-containing protein, partial [Anaerolineales bacterium]
MKWIKYLALGVLTLLAASAFQTSAASNGTATLIYGTYLARVPLDAAATPADLLTQAGVTLQPGDAVLVNGLPAPHDQPVQDGAVIQLRPAVNITILSGETRQQVAISASTVAEALAAAGMPLYASDFIDPGASSALYDGMVISHRPARELVVSVDGGQVRIRAAAQTVGRALAEGGLALTGLDYSIPAENEPVPADGQIRIVRVSEALILLQKTLPFSSEFQATAELEIDQQDLLQAGEPGLAISRVRLRYEDGQEVARQSEAEVVVRPARNRVVGYGTKIVIRTATVDGIQIEYWRVKKMYATSYSPCRSAASRCFNYTASGKPVVRGVVAMQRMYYRAMRGQPLYIPG